MILVAASVASWTALWLHVYRGKRRQRIELSATRTAASNSASANTYG
jgi:hypothetical protein